MVTSLGGIGGATQYLRYPAAREGAAQQQANPAPNAAHPALANVVGELNAVTGPAQDMHVELDLGGGKQGARIVSDSGTERPIPLEYVAQLAALLRQSGAVPAAAGGRVDEIA
ncbi:hypothetical protein [Methylogaea oryzae]|uniref:Uncharacterized protein n=1 Tax=Methylogaea oryzae TaxID=1295382 RepID=A0A8D5AM47_9GAMM|nr:hypothetical protein [Methylogaea oryzae]BBL70770.1 hypothetical protein MoryE10_13760 [Methylogaea oryzae]